MTKIILTAVSRNDRTAKNGKKYISIGFKCTEYGDRWINGFGSKDNADWKEGDEVKVEIFEKDGKDGKKYLNFSIPDLTAETLIRLEALERTVEKIRKALEPIYLDWKRKNNAVNTEPLKVRGTDINYPEEPNATGDGF